MLKAVITLGAFVLTALGWSWGEDQRQVRPVLRLKEETMTLEYTATNGEAVVRLAAEGEVGMREVVIRDPNGRPVFELKAAEGREVELQGFVIETRETDLSTLFRQFMQGSYDMRARAAGGQDVRGSAKLSHDLLRAPVVVYPRPGALVPSTGLRVTWLSDPEAKAYRVVFEQDENDGLIVELPAGTSSFRVPDGQLAPRKKTQLEIGAISASGNCTLVEVLFATL